MERLIRLEGQGRAVDSAWARVAVARCRAFLVPARELPSGVESALELHEGEASAFERARTELCYGERLRRTRERKLARQHLRSSHATFERLGARTWSDRARVELEATGEHVRKRDPTAAERLTPQEFQIAMLVAEGLTNRDVGARMFLSPKTVEFHLSRVFRKLDVRARGELIRLFAGGTGAEAPQRPGPDVSQSSSPWSRPSETSTRSPSIGPPP
jgi:DNA-binding CsgD family transcriptional regulator